MSELDHDQLLHQKIHLFRQQISMPLQVLLHQGRKLQSYLVMPFLQESYQDYLALL